MKLTLPILVGVLILSSCATPRSNALLGVDYSSQPPRVTMRWHCNGQDFTTQGLGVCEQMGPSQSRVSVKIPPLEGRVIYSDGQMKRTEDFNWAPKEGFWIWKKKPIRDTWAELDLGELSTTYGDIPVAMDVAAVHEKIGVIVTRGVLYHRICNDRDIPCSRLVVRFECGGVEKRTGSHEIGKCERLSGGALALRVQLRGPGYEATLGAKVYARSARLGLSQAYSPSAADFQAGEMKLETPFVPSGPSLIGIRLAWIESGAPKSVETRILVMGFSPEWTGLDQPHYLASQGGLEFMKPVMADVLEVNLYEGRTLKEKKFSSDKVIDFQRPKAGQVACAFAWQRDSSDQTILCLDEGLQEVGIP